MIRLPQLTTFSVVEMEWRKLTTVRLTAVLVVASLVLSALTGAFYAWVVLQVGADTPVSPVEATLVTTTRGTITTIVAGLVGVLCVTSDRRSGGLSMAAVIEPVRSRVLLAKVLVSAAVGGTVGALALGLNALVATAILGASGLVSDPWSWTRLVAGAVAVHAGWAVVGVAVGMLVRATPAAVLTLVVGPWLVQRALSLLALTGTGGHLLAQVAALSPFAAATRLQSPLTITSPVIVADTGEPQAVLLAVLSFTVFVALALWGADRSFTASDLRPD